MEVWDIKRFVELWIGLEEFRGSLAEDPEAAVHDYGLNVEPEPCLVLLEPETKNLDQKKFTPQVQAYRQWLDYRLGLRRDRQQRAATRNPVFAAWRGRQMAGLRSQVSPVEFQINGQLPFVIELTRGCSIGCDYCALNAGPLRRIARLTPENEGLFRDILRGMADFFGEGADTGFLYYATEPLDNPDYELYQRVFQEELGGYPATTTAAWWRDTERTRRLLHQSRSNNGWNDRFSINSREHLRVCLQTFTAQELAEVDLIIHLPGSKLKIWGAGRGATAMLPSLPGTAACVTGFRINLPDRTVSLEAPTADVLRWPEGRMILAQDRFNSRAELQDFMNQSLHTIMEFEPDDDFIPHWRPDWEHFHTEAGDIGFSSPYTIVSMANNLGRELYGLIDGQNNIGKIVDSLMTAYEPAFIYYALNQWWKQGYFEEPRQSYQLS